MILRNVYKQFLSSPRLKLPSQISLSYIPLATSRVISRAMTVDAQPESTVALKTAFQPRYVDIGINLTDSMYSGSYHGTQRHPSDLPAVLTRAQEGGCHKLILTGSDLDESKNALAIAKEHPGFLYTTVGVHPCCSASFDKFPAGPSVLLQELKTLAETATEQGACVAFGEIGLDYDRLSHAPADTQRKYFAAQLDIASQLSPPLPLFLHSRAAAVDFAALLRERLDGLPRRGVVHSFTGTLDEMQELVEMGFDIGINGCSLKTAENCAVVKEVPLGRLQLETDGPWCEIRGSHAGMVHVRAYEERIARLAKEGKDGEEGDVGPLREWKSVKKEKFVEGSMVKGRNEPCMIGRVAVAVAGIKGVSVKEVAEQAWANSCAMFGLGE